MLLEAKAISKYYKGRPILTNISFGCSSGEVIGIVGPNGAGKSTLLRILAGVIDPDQGEVAIDQIRSSVKNSALWGYVPEELGLYPQMKVIEQLIHFGALKGMPENVAKAKALELLSQCKMSHYMQSKADELSKGNQQRVQFLSSILHDPQLLILDEPFSGLDPVQADWLKDQILTFKKQGKLILYSSHRMHSVEALCDRILVIHEGQLLANGTARDLCQQNEQIWEISMYGGDVGGLIDEKKIMLQKRDVNEVVVKVKVKEIELAKLIAEIEATGASLNYIRRHRLTLHEVFVQLTSQQHVS